MGKKYVKRNSRRVLLLFWSLVGIGVIVYTTSHRGHLFGQGPTLQGGVVGRKLDNTVKSLLFVWRDRSYRRAFKETFGYNLPASTTVPQTGVPVLLHTYLTESLFRARDRLLKQNNLDQYCPHCWIQPLVGHWYASELPRLGIDDASSSTVIEWQESELEAWVLQQFGVESSSFNGNVVDLTTLWQIYQGFSNYQDRVQWAALLLVLTHGGYFASPNVDKLMRDKVPKEGSIIVLEEDSREILYLRIEESFECATHNLGTIANFHLSWPTLMQKFQDSLESSCVDQAISVMLIKSPNNRRQVSRILNIMATETPIDLTAKQSKHYELERQNCRAGWWCHRCLRLPWRGSIEACQWLCNSCYVQIMGGFQPDYREIVLDMKPVQDDSSLILQKTAHRIPRIIHQTWFEDIDTSHYPHLTRLQNSWKATGWEYRFYNDETARAYIERYYPNRFVEAYDALLPGAFKADLFRLLVLLREGGVYADIDVQLDTDLDSFLAADISFFVPRDCPIDRWPDSNYCLWNGFMGSTAGHPILIQAVQDVLHHVRNRLDYYDLEGALLQNDLGAELWKLRSIPILLLTGPCALGISVNKAAQVPNVLRGFPIGWLPEMEGVLLLLADRYDLGELRFTDVDRNLLVASTNADAMARKAIRKEEEQKPEKKESVHYSKSESEIVGEYGIYKDNLAANERVVLRYQSA